MKFNRYKDINKFVEENLDLLLQKEWLNNLMVANCLEGMEVEVEKWILATVENNDKIELIMLYREPWKLLMYSPTNNKSNELYKFAAEEFYKIFPNTVHQFTGVDYIDFYKKTCECPCEIILANDPKAILKYADNVIVASIHKRARDKKILQQAGVKKVYCLDELLTSSVDGSGYNEKYGLLGSNLATENSVKLFPRNCQPLVDDVQARIKAKYGKNVEVMVYGDGAFKDPQGQIWELADPVVSPAYTSGLVGTPNELKLKYLSDNEFKDLSGDELKEAMIKRIKEKDSDLKGRMETQGTTPRQLTDLLGSLSDLTSGSGDKGTPVILIQNYFSNYANQ